MAIRCADKRVLKLLPKEMLKDPIMYPGGGGC